MAEISIVTYRSVLARRSQFRPFEVDVSIRARRTRIHSLNASGFDAERLWIRRGSSNFELKLLELDRNVGLDDHSL